MKISRARIQQTKVNLTEEQEQRLAKLYSILDMINPAETSQDKQSTDHDKTMIVADASQY